MINTETQNVFAQWRRDREQQEELANDDNAQLERDNNSDNEQDSSSSSGSDSSSSSDSDSDGRITDASPVSSRKRKSSKSSIFF
eukprot:UN00363